MVPPAPVALATLLVLTLLAATLPTRPFLSTAAALSALLAHLPLVGTRPGSVLAAAVGSVALVVMTLLVAAFADPVVPRPLPAR